MCCVFLSFFCAAIVVVLSFLLWFFFFLLICWYFEKSVLGKLQFTEGGKSHVLRLTSNASRTVDYVYLKINEINH